VLIVSACVYWIAAFAAMTAENAEARRDTSSQLAARMSSAASDYASSNTEVSSISSIRGRHGLNGVSMSLSTLTSAGA
jgi:hypothetical protein